jgi:hypothetical protein
MATSSQTQAKRCSVQECQNTFYGKGFCKKHYERVRQHGDPLVVKTKPGQHAYRYLVDVAIPYKGDDCLIWPYCRVDGYARIGPSKECKTTYVSRRICEEVHGAPPTPKHEAAHSCGNGNGGCVTPGHLSWKTAKANQSDRVTHGTANRGENNAKAKLTEDQVREIRALKGAETHLRIAARFGVSKVAVTNIMAGTTWSHVQ